MYSLLLTVNVIAAISVIGLVLVQHGKGADMGAAFGSGASGSLFGATGAASFLSRMTAIAATVFIVSCLGLNYVASQTSKSTAAGVADALKGQVIDNSVPEIPSAPVKDQRVQDIPK